MYVVPCQVQYLLNDVLPLANPLIEQQCNYCKAWESLQNANNQGNFEALNLLVFKTPA